MIGSNQEPVVEESRETILAQIDALEAGTIPVVMLPIGSTFVPTYDSRLRSIHIPEFAGAGTYIFDPKQINVGQIIAMVRNGRHGALLGHVQTKGTLQGVPRERLMVVRVVREDGLTIQESVIDGYSDLLPVLEDKMRFRFPGATVIRLYETPGIIRDRAESRHNSILHAFRDDKYRIGDMQAIGYLRTNTEMFPEGYLGNLYAKMKTGISGKTGDSWLNNLFCGMTDVSYDAIVSYLAARPLVIMGVWRDGQFDEAGFIFPTVNLGAGDQKAAFAGYGFFRKYWRTQEQQTLAMLGLSFFFVELGLLAINGMRYADNGLTRNFLTQFGFRDVGRIPKYMLQNGKLVDGVASSLLREDFEVYVERKLLEDFDNGSDEPENPLPLQQEIWESSPPQ